MANSKVLQAQKDYEANSAKFYDFLHTLTTKQNFKAWVLEEQLDITFSQAKSFLHKKIILKSEVLELVANAPALTDVEKTTILRLGVLLIKAGDTLRSLVGEEGVEDTKEKKKTKRHLDLLATGNRCPHCFALIRN